MNRLAFALLLIVCGCGGSPDAVSTAASCAFGEHHVVIAFGNIPTTAQNTRDGSCNSLMLISDDVDSSSWLVLIIHELWHTVGYDTHLEFGCYAHGFQLPDYPAEPCQEELDAMRTASTGTYVIFPEPALRDAALTAASFWNGWTNSSMFVVN